MGFGVGFAIKKILKLLLVILGVFFVGLQYLSFQGFIDINYDRFESVFTNAIGMMSTGLDLPSFLTMNIPFMASFGLGLAVGFKKG